MIAHSRDKYASTPQNPSRPREFACQNGKSNRDYDDGWAGKYHHDCSKKENGETDHTDYNFARYWHAIETKARG
jgi:hypothetical protein